MVYAYHRTSTKEQNLDRGIHAINSYCEVNKIALDGFFTDQHTGKSFDRPGYIKMKEMAVNKGDIIIVTEIDRFGRDKEGILKELRYFRDKGVRMVVLEIPTTMTNYSAFGDTLASMMMETINNLMIEMFATFAHAEMMKREERQKQGIEAMKARGEWENYGRPRVMSLEYFAEYYDRVVSGEIRPFECMRDLGLTMPTFYRYKKEYEEKYGDEYGNDDLETQGMAYLSNEFWRQLAEGKKNNG